MKWIDAHNHLHDARLAPYRAQWMAALERRGAEAVVNGTHEEDWEAVAALAREKPWVRPAFGLHPWHVRERSAEWRKSLAGFLEATPRASIGEIGLDRWVQDADVAAQEEVFRAQLAMAAERDLPATIHCLRAWGPLWGILREAPVPARGFLLHAYGGPVEMVPGFVKRGGFFSFSAYFLHPKKAAQREVFREIPLDRLLVETDAPDMPPPEVEGAQFCGDAIPRLNSPETIALAYRGLAELRGLTLEETGEAVAENFRRLFGKIPSPATT